MLGIDISQNIDKQTLTLAKKKFLAEAELSESQTVMLHGQEMTKNDILNLFDEWSAIDDWNFHYDIAKDAALLYFLEGNAYSKNGTRFKKNHFESYKNTDIIERLSPFFATAYQNFVIISIKKHAYEDLAIFYLEAPFLIINESNKKSANLKIRQFLEREETKLEEIIEQVKKKQKVDYQIIRTYYCNKSLLWSLNQLPAESFAWLRDSYGITLYNLAGAFWNVKENFNAYEVIDSLSYLDNSEKVQAAISKRKEAFHNAMHKSEQEDSQIHDNFPSTFKIIVTICTLIALLAFFAKACN
jgi:hypothetical protein